MNAGGGSHVHNNYYYNNNKPSNTENTSNKGKDLSHYGSDFECVGSYFVEKHSDIKFLLAVQNPVGVDPANHICMCKYFVCDFYQLFSPMIEIQVSFYALRGFFLVAPVPLEQYFKAHLGH